MATLGDAAMRYGALLIGPGLGRSEEAGRLVLDVLARPPHGPRAAVVDADALYALSASPDWWSSVALPVVVTPHAGEMARLTGLASEQVEHHRLDIASAYAAQWGQVVLLKGAPTITASPDGRLAINPTGNPLLATAGSGDVLTGAIAALLAGGVAHSRPQRPAPICMGSPRISLCRILATAECWRAICSRIFRKQSSMCFEMAKHGPSSLEHTRASEIGKCKGLCMKVRAIMGTGPISVDADTSVVQVARVLIEHRCPAFPWSTSRAVAGVVTEADLIVRNANLRMPRFLTFVDSLVPTGGCAS